MWRIEEKPRKHTGEQGFLMSKLWENIVSKLLHSTWCRANSSGHCKSLSTLLSFMSTIQSLKIQKRALRKAIGSKLSAIPTQSIHEQCNVASLFSRLPGWHADSTTAYSIIQRLGSFPAFSRSKSLSCYLSMPSGEVDTSSLVSQILDSGGILCGMIFIFDNVNQGRTLFVPKITNRSGEMEFLKLYGKADLASLPNGVWGIKEPDSDWQGQPRAKGELSTSLWHGIPNGLNICVVLFLPSARNLRIGPHSPPSCCVW